MIRISILLLMFCAAFALGQISSDAAVLVEIPIHETTDTSNSVNYTGDVFDLAIDGNAFFRVWDSKTGEIFATRYGSFRIDAEGYIILFRDLRLQGFNKPVRYDRQYVRTDPVGDLRFGSNLPEGLPTNATASSLGQIIIGSTGRITGILSDGTTYTLGKIFLDEFEHPENLRRKWQYFYTNLDAAKPIPPDSSPREINPPPGPYQIHPSPPNVKSGVLDASFPRA